MLCTITAYFACIDSKTIVLSYLAFKTSLATKNNFADASQNTTSE